LTMSWQSSNMPSTSSALMFCPSVVNCRSWMSPLSPMGRDNHLDTFYTRNRWQRRHLYLQVATRTVFLLSFFITVKIPQATRHKAPTSLNAMVGPWNSSVNRFRFRLPPQGNQSRAYQQYFF
jgi:hypothetical protein